MTLISPPHEAAVRQSTLLFVVVAPHSCTAPDNQILGGLGLFSALDVLGDSEMLFFDSCCFYLLPFSIMPLYMYILNVIDLNFGYTYLFKYIYIYTHTSLQICIYIVHKCEKKKQASSRSTEYVSIALVYQRGASMLSYAAPETPIHWDGKSEHKLFMIH